MAGWKEKKVVGIIAGVISLVMFSIAILSFVKSQQPPVEDVESREAE